MRSKLQGFLNALSPLLYLICKFLVLGTALGLFIGDFITAAGIISAIGLYYILDGKQKQESQEMYYEMMQQAMMEEAKRHGKSDEA